MNSTSYMELPDEQAEEAIFDKLRTIDAAMHVGYASIGVMLRTVETRELWRLRKDPNTGMPCRSFTRYVRCCCPYSYSTAFAAKSDVKELEADLSAEDISAIPQSNFATIRQLSSAVRKDPKIIQAAKTQEPGEFVETVRAGHPEQAIERKCSLRFNPPESAAVYIDSVLKEAENHGATSRDHALEIIARAAEESWQFEQQCENAMLGEHLE